MKTMPKRKFQNRLNDLDSKKWLKFQKSWFIHNPPPRRKDVLRHPAKFPESLAQEFIEFFTKKGQVVLDPMVGTGSTQIAALRSGRHSYGIELNPKYAEISRQIIDEERKNLFETVEHLASLVITGDAGKFSELAAKYEIPLIDYMITSPPYWNMLHAKGSKTQENRRSANDLDLFYSDNPNDLGNFDDYDQFLDQLVYVYESIKPFMRPRAYLTIIVKNVKKGGIVYPLAWDLGHRLGKIFQLKDERIWCQGDLHLFPYGYGSAWVSNTFHHYCLQFRNE